MADAILVLNAGSSNLKFSVFLDQDRPQTLLSGQIEELLTCPRFEVRDAAGNVVGAKRWETGTNLGHHGAIEFLLARSGGEVLAGHRVVAAGHRVVHGGTQFIQPVLVDTNTLVALERLVPLAPLQQPHNLAAIRAVAQHAPQLPQVACFDTSFHRTQPWVAETFALPRRYTEGGVRRYGFHGLSYEYVASVLPTLAGGSEFERTVVAHLGNGASMCALRGYKSIATTMGLTAIDGLPMGTRCGSLDPGVRRASKKGRQNLRYRKRFRHPRVSGALTHHLLSLQNPVEKLRDYFARIFPQPARAPRMKTALDPF